MRLSAWSAFLVIMISLCFLSPHQGCASQKAAEKREEAASSPREEEPLKKPNVAGQFYRDDREALTKELKGYLEKAGAAPPGTEEVCGIVSPHAGTIYSGPVAAYGYRLVKGLPSRTVIIIAPTHHFDFEGFAVYDRGAFRTPLGDVPVDRAMAQRLMEKCSLVKKQYEPFEREHSLELQIPFLQVALEDFKIVPLIAGRNDLEGCRKLAQAMASLFGPSETRPVLLVASSDLSHYHPYKEAQSIDGKTIKAIEKMDAPALLGEGAGNCELCGAVPVATVILAMKELGCRPVLLKYANSGDTAGDKSRVVGYASVAFSRKPETGKVKGMKDEFLTGEDKKELLVMARKTLEEYLKTGKKPEFFKDSPIPENLKMETGMFVTLHKHGALRGCIGHLTGGDALYKSVVELAISSATRDTRFPQVKYDELKDIHIEISVMSPLRRAESADEIVMGKHGVIVRKGFHSGVFLPQVATETGWTKEEFMSQLCWQKAGLSPDAWKEKDTELLIFTADVFGEPEK
ncbi:MAG: AmmeMemoRadiSam system protein B [Candidatus Eremiobacteraeota bacterium]|nr:AmmeMemoRadiSam system protein B [Candidatus Eremiobacteraeota bacterium]